jgi:subfamily B ATP-binding cassette protein HlyB/CyaB
MRDEPRDGADATMAPAEVLWVLGSLCNLHRQPFDAAAFARRTPPPHRLSTLVDALRESGFEARVERATVDALARAPMPCVALMRDGPALVVSVARDRVVWFASGSRAPCEAGRDAFASQATGTAILVGRPDDGTADAADAAPRPFGFATVFAELVRHRDVVRDVLAASLALHLTALAMPLASQAIIDKVVVNRAGGTLAVVAAALALLIAFSALLGWLRQSLVVHAGTRVDAVLGSRVYAHLLGLPPGYFERRPVGVLVARLHGVETIREFLTGAAVTVALDVPFALVFVVVMGLYSVPLTLVALVAIAALAGLSLAVAPPLQRRLNEQFTTGARTQALATESLAGVETVKALELERAFSKRYDDALGAYLRAGFSTRQLANGYQSAAGALEQAMAAAILCAGAWLCMRGDDFTIGMLVAFQMLASRVSGPVVRLAGLWQQCQQAAIAVRRLADIMDVPVEPRANVPSASTGPARLSFASVGFRHGDGAWILRGLDLEIAPGECVVITGPSGCGKSTLCRLAAGFAFATEGSVRLDGRVTRTLAADTLRGALGIVPQDTVLFAGTVLDNLLLGHAHATQVDVEAACRRAGVHDAIAALPEGYRTRLGERGIGLSGGQKQRVALARALLRSPRLMLLDEPLSQLDAVAAAEIGRAISALKGTTTLVVVSHVVPPTLAADRVVRLDPRATSLPIP